MYISVVNVAVIIGWGRKYIYLVVYLGVMLIKCEYIFQSKVCIFSLDSTKTRIALNNNMILKL